MFDNLKEIVAIPAIRRIGIIAVISALCGIVSTELSANAGKVTIKHIKSVRIMQITFFFIKSLPNAIFELPHIYNATSHQYSTCDYISAVIVFLYILSQRYCITQVKQYSLVARSFLTDDCIVIFTMLVQIIVISASNSSLSPQ